MGLQDVKLLVMEATGLGKDALHIYIGLCAYFGASLIFRWPAGDARPLAFAALAAIGGELWDVVDNLRASAPMQWQGHCHDVWNTMFWPVAIVALARTTRLFRR